MKYIFIILFGLFAISTAIGQGTTTSSITGKITDKENNSLIGVNVFVKHLETGNTYGNISDFNGNYRITNVRVGGPYQITYSYVGFSDIVYDNVFLQLGESFDNDVILGEEQFLIEGVEIVGSKLFAGQSAGASTQINEEDVLYMPTVDRELDDYVRLTPQVKESFGEGISVAGMNNRFNAIYIDGAVNNDVFGLAASGTNGGQTGISPISPEIIDQIQVVISPYDVSYGGFAGGGINVVTKSGTNSLKGSAYFYSASEKLVGKNNQIDIDRLNEDYDPGDSSSVFYTREKVDAFTDRSFGFTLGGPIVKDKLFFFVNAEIQKEEIPLIFNYENYLGDSSLDEIEALRTKLISDFDYDPGEFLINKDQLDANKIFGKLDYNFNQNHKISLRHQFTKGENFNRSRSGDTFINFGNNGIYFPSFTNSSAIELNSTFGNNASNNLIIGYTRVIDDRDPLGSDFPRVDIEDGDGSIVFGSEGFSSANSLDQKVLTITNNFKLFKGDHTFTIGTHNEISNFNNLFIRQNFGEYEFDSLEEFMNGGDASGYERSYSLVDDIAGDGSAAAANFSAIQFGLYAQDEWSLSRNLTLIAGLRLDVPFIVENQEEDVYFQYNYTSCNNRTLS